MTLLRSIAGTGTERGLQMRVLLRRFFRQDAGAVSVDLVVLTAACVGLSVAVLSTLNNQFSNVGDQVGVQVAATPLGTDGDTE